MSQTRRTFDGSFKLQIVRMIKDQWMAVSQICRDMNLSETVVRLCRTTSRLTVFAQMSIEDMLYSGEVLDGECRLNRKLMPLK